MIWTELLLIFLLALLFAGLLGATGWRRPGATSVASGMLFVVLLFFLALWAGRLWLVPMGPMLWGVAWAPLLILGLIVALLLTSLAPPRRRRPSSKSDIVVEEEAGPAEALASILLWVLFAILVVSIVAGYA